MSVSEIKFDCPECGEGLAIDRRAIGHQVACPFCKDPITVPDIPEPTAIEPKPIPLPESAPSLEDLANSRPEVPEVSSKPAPPMASETAEPQSPPAKAGGLPPKRRPGESPKAMAEGPSGEAAQAPVSMPTNRPSTPIPPTGSPKQSRPMQDPPAKPEVTTESRRVEEPTGNAPDGYEERVRRKRKRRNPDEHRLNPREKPKMVAFDEAIGEGSFKKHPGHGKAPFWKRLLTILSILGILAALGLGFLKKKQLATPDERLNPVELSRIDKEFELAKERLDKFREAGSVAEKMSFVRAPLTALESYPPLAERMDAYYGKHTLNSHFPALTRASAVEVDAQGQPLENSPAAGDSSFLRVLMEDQVESYIYFEKSAAGGYALDWDSFVGYNPVNWTEFLIDPTREAESGVFRLIITRTDLYTGIYQDESKYRSYEVTDLASQLSAIAYVVRGTATEEAIEAEFTKRKLRDSQRVLMIADVNLVERGVDGSHLTYIDKIIRSSWLLP